MRLAWQIVMVLGFFAFLVFEDVMLAIADWQLTRPTALSDYVAQADLRVVNDDEARAMGEDNSFQSCEYKRSIFLYRGMICFLRVSEELQETRIFYWAPQSLLKPYGLGYFGNPKSRDAVWVVSKETGAIEKEK